MRSGRWLREYDLHQLPSLTPKNLLFVGAVDPQFIYSITKSILKESI